MDDILVSLLQKLGPSFVGAGLALGLIMWFFRERIQGYKTSVELAEKAQGMARKALDDVENKQAINVSTADNLEGYKEQLQSQYKELRQEIDRLKSLLETEQIEKENIIQALTFAEKKLQKQSLDLKALEEKLLKPPALSREQLSLYGLKEKNLLTIYSS